MNWTNTSNATYAYIRFEYVPPPPPKPKPISAFAVLGVPEQSPFPVVKSAYRRLAKKYHPDLGGEGTREEREQCMKLINAAYDFLKGLAS